MKNGGYLSNWHIQHNFRGVLGNHVLVGLSIGHEKFHGRYVRTSLIQEFFRIGGTKCVRTMNTVYSLGTKGGGGLDV